MNEIAKLLRAGDYDQAAALTDKKLEREPENPKFLEYKAIALKKSGRLREALKFYDEALKYENSGDLWFNRAVCIRAMNDREMHDEASHSYKMAVEADPLCSDALQNQGNVSSRIADCAGDAENSRPWFDQSEAAYRQALKGSPNSAELHCNIADLYVKQKRMKDALKELAIAEELEPGYQPLWYIRGYAQMKLGQFSEAINSLQQVQAIDPDSGWSMRARINEGNCLLELGRMDEAVSAYETAAAMDPPGFEEFIYMSRANAWYNIAFVRKCQGDMTAAGEALKKSYDNDYKFQLEHWLYEPKTEITGPAAKNDEHIRD